MDTERHNTEQVMQLNQRGGRTLSIADLCLAGTLTPRMAALCWMRIESGASLVTGAVPGGAGKTTLMGALLTFLPPGERIVTVADRAVLDNALEGSLPRPATLLAHEIGSGRWFGYIWGRDAADFFRSGGRGMRCVTCLHTDDPGQTREILLPLGVREQDLARVGLQLYMHRGPRHGHVLHRVTALHCRPDGDLACVTKWNKKADRHEWQLPAEDLCERLAATQNSGVTPDDLKEEWDRRTSWVQELVDSETVAWQDVRAAVLAYDGR